AGDASPASTVRKTASRLRSCIRLDYRNLHPISQPCQDANQQVAGYVIEVVIENRGHPGSRSARPFGDFGMRDPLSQDNFLQALEQRVLELPLFRLCRGESHGGSQFLRRLADDWFESMHPEAPLNAFAPPRFRGEASAGSF